MKTNNKGFVTLIFILVIAMIGTLVFILGQSRLFLALQRNQSGADVLIASYQAESEINDLLYKIYNGFLKDKNFSYKKNLADNFSLEVKSDGKDGEQIIDVLTKRSFATSQIRAILNTTVETTSTVSRSDIVLMLDCTGSMDSFDNRTTSRMQEQERAAKRFINRISNMEEANSIRLGIGVFGTRVKWLETTSGQNITPHSDISFSKMVEAVDQGFGIKRENSPACFVNGQDLGYTNIGGGFVFAHNYFASRGTEPGVKQVEVLISDGQPTARFADPACPPDPGRTVEDSESEGLVYAKCAIADKNTKWNGKNFGKRDPNVEAFAVTVLTGADRNGQMINSFRNLLGADHYYSPENANKLSEIIDIIFNTVATRSGVTTIQRVVPNAD